MHVKNCLVPFLAMNLIGVQSLEECWRGWWSLCTLYLHACQVRVTVGDSGLCCCTLVTYFFRFLAMALACVVRLRGLHALQNCLVPSVVLVLMCKVLPCTCFTWVCVETSQ